VVDEITIIGSRCGPFAPALRLMDQNAVDPDVLITAEYKLEDGLAALEEAARAGVLKVLLRP
jgi:threonine dehydrogenase-like Zn-dependent dehydrogenase